ncbi:MAG: cytidylyltransferase domain-containing protein [Candidatus Zixiibacteriota bacterium]
MRTVVITQARTGSTRLPGKIFKEVLGKPLLEYHLERLREIKNAEAIVVATTDKSADDKVFNFCREKKINCFRGSEDDVLDRYYRTAGEYEAEAVVRVTSDCPLIDPEVVDGVIAAFLENAGRFDYASNTLVRTYPRGLDCEIFPKTVLDEIHGLTAEKTDREHVTAYIYRHPEKYRLLNVPRLLDVSHYRWTVDTADDFELVSRMLEALYPRKPEFRLEDCLQLFEQHPDWEAINRHIVQKALEE